MPDMPLPPGFTAQKMDQARRALEAVLGAGKVFFEDLDRTWLHLDIAGPAFIDKDSPLGPKGATGVAVRTILTYLTEGR